MQKRSTDYMSQFVKMFKTMNVNGAAPWWWPGGFRMVEMSDCGFCGPTGKLRPIGEVYSEYLSWLNKRETSSFKKHIVTVDSESDARGYYHICKSLLKDENKIAEENGAVLVMVTEATGKTSDEVPLTAVGNVSYNGYNPLKYLNGEFNEVLISVNSSEYSKIQKGEKICVSLGSKIKLKVYAGNIKETKWLSPSNSSKGGIYLCSVDGSDVNLKSPLIVDTDYLEDGEFEECVITDSIKERIKINLRFALGEKAIFGECFSFEISPSKLVN